MKYILALIAIITSFNLWAQGDIQTRISEIESSINVLDSEKENLKEQLEDLKLRKLINDLQRVGYPKCDSCSKPIEHSAMALSYNEKHEQANWVAHIITPDIVEGNVSRTNDFRKDPKVTTGSSAKADYWYSGYDRGHLAPSADFRWSRKALSESYFYSNMAPQKPEFNREEWAELENLMRYYVTEHNTELYVVSGGVLKVGLPTMQNEGRENEVSIPEHFFKVVMNLKDSIGVAFLMPNQKCQYPVLSYAIPIDSVEQITGINFFPGLSEKAEQKIEATTNTQEWKDKKHKNDIEPINPKDLPKGKINTIQAKYQIDKNACVCGTVVSTKYSEKSGSTFINLDKKFPNQVFSISIWKQDRTNFSYKPEVDLKGKKICVTGHIKDNHGTPTMNLTNEKSIEILEDGETLMEHYKH